MSGRYILHIYHQHELQITIRGCCVYVTVWQAHRESANWHHRHGIQLLRKQISNLKVAKTNVNVCACWNLWKDGWKLCDSLTWLGSKLLIMLTMNVSPLPAKSSVHDRGCMGKGWGSVSHGSLSLGRGKNSMRDFHCFPLHSSVQHKWHFLSLSQVFSMNQNSKLSSEAGSKIGHRMLRFRVGTSMENLS